MKKVKASLNERTGARIRAIRQIMGLTQAELAGKIEVTPQQLQKYERGTNNINLNMLGNISAALDHDLADILDFRAGPNDTADFVSRLESMDAGERTTTMIIMKKLWAMDPGVRKSLLKLIDSLSAESEENQ